MAAMRAWLNGHALRMIAAAAAAVWLQDGIAVAVAAALSVAVLIRGQLGYLAGLSSAGGHANLLTLLRLCMVCAAAVAIGRAPTGWVLSLLAGNVMLDTLDGLIARKLSQESAFGSVFDRETDGIFVLVAYLYFCLDAGISPWILIPGLMPYLYHLAEWGLGARAGGEKRQRWAALLAGVNFVLLLAAIAAPIAYRPFLLAVSVGVVMFSFAIGFGRLLGNRRAG
jgi:phosphatidylglycerophosphate synthase